MTLSRACWGAILLLHLLVSPDCVFNEPHLQNGMSHPCVPRLRCTWKKWMKMGQAAFVFHLGAGEWDAADWKLSKANVLSRSQRTGSAISSNAIWTQPRCISVLFKCSNDWINWRSWGCESWLLLKYGYILLWLYSYIQLCFSVLLISLNVTTLLTSCLMIMLISVGL